MERRDKEVLRLLLIRKLDYDETFQESSAICQLDCLVGDFILAYCNLSYCPCFYRNKFERRGVLMSISAASQVLKVCI